VLNGIEKVWSMFKDIIDTRSTLGVAPVDRELPSTSYPAKETFFSIKILSGLFVCLFLFFLWCYLYKATSLGFRGISLSIGQNPHAGGERNWYEMVAGFGNDLPMCFRVMMGWIPLGVDYIFVKPLSFVFGSEVLNSFVWGSKVLGRDSTILLAAAFTFSSSLIFTFLGIWNFFPKWVSVFAVMSFGLLPLTVPILGINRYDFLVLLYWTIVILSFSNLLNQMSIRRVYILIACLSVFGQWTMENTGVAFSISLFLLSVTKSFHGWDKPFFKMWKISVACVIGAALVAWLMTHRHPDVFWIHPGKSFNALYETYGQYNSIKVIIRTMFYMIRLPMILGTITFFLMFVFRFRLEQEMICKFKYSFLISLMALFAFLLTAAVGTSVSGLYLEWTRQYLPLTLLFTWSYFNLIVLIYAYFRLDRVGRH
jgi:hypothetical protein